METLANGTDATEPKEMSRKNVFQTKAINLIHKQSKTKCKTNSKTL